MKKVLFAFCAIYFVLLFGCASTPNEKNVAEGKLFVDVLTNKIDSSIPIEKHCYVVNLDLDAKVMSIDGNAVRDKGLSSLNNWLGYAQIVILPPGTHEFNFSYYNSSYGEASGKGTVNLVAGHYYFINTDIKGNSIAFKVEFLRQYAKVRLFGATVFSSEMIPVESIVEGINAKIATKFNDFKSGMEEPTVLMIENNLNMPINHLYISPAGKNTWTDILETPIPPGSEYSSFSLLHIWYDIRIEDSAGNIYSYMDCDFTGTDGSKGRGFDITPERKDKQ